jgi:futalosine hydrolase
MESSESEMSAIGFMASLLSAGTDSVAWNSRCAQRTGTGCYRARRMSLFVHAHPAEADGLSLPRILCLGTGKTAAGIALSRALAIEPVELVVVFGVAGAYPGSGLDVGDVCLVAQDVLADDGVEDEDGFRDLAAMNLGTNGPWLADPVRTGQLAVRLLIPVVPAATVSTCTATNRASERIAARTSALIETMEGAAIAAACAHANVPWIGVRAISNRTGDRANAGWDLPRAVAALHDAVRVCATTL